MVLYGLVAVYTACLLLLSLYTLGQLVLLIQYLRLRGRPQAAPPAVDDWPLVTVQLPLYNEPFVAGRLLNAVTRLDYPLQRLHIQILDDSTDGTTRQLARAVRALRTQGWHIQHLHRRQRTGFKAGALADGLRRTRAEFVAIFDADFVPPPHFLKQTIPHLLADERLAVVQTAWGHLNAAANWLTRAQRLATDAHFVIEQTARSCSGWILPFNGTGGVWRARAIHDAGGWSADTLTEDCDLSYRAQLAGWRALYLPAIVVPGELPTQLGAYVQQQGRWAQGNTQCLHKHLPALLRVPMPLGRRLMALHHLCQYLPQPLMLLSLLVSLPLMLNGASVAFAPLGVIGLIPPLLYVVSQRALAHDSGRRLLAFPALVLVGTGLIANNSLAVLRGLLRRGGTFERTPKLGDSPRAALGRPRRAFPGLIPLAMAAYAALACAVAWHLRSPMLPYVALYALAFNGVIMAGLAERWAHRAAHASAAAQRLNARSALHERRLNR